MAAPSTLPVLLSSLTQSLSLAQEATPKIAALESPKDGISLLDVKNELLLSYLQNLIFLILVKLRNAGSAPAATHQGDRDKVKSGLELEESVRTKLIELRVYLERGARPLEGKLAFSIERFLRAPKDAKSQEESARQKRKKSQKGDMGTSGQKSDSDGSAGPKDDESDSGFDDDDDYISDLEAPDTSDRGSAPNIHALVDDEAVASRNRGGGGGDAPPGIYQPPRRQRKLMETPAQKREKAERRPQRSNAVDEYLQSEYGFAPVAEPSIGTTILQGGRKMKTEKERKDEEERREYEEMNLVRLPKASKKERAKQRLEAGRRGHMQFGGEEWRELGEGVDRIERLTKRQAPAGSNSVRALLEKSRKRGLDASDGPRGSGHSGGGGAEMGERFQKKVRLMEAGRRDRGKKR